MRGVSSPAARVGRRLGVLVMSLCALICAVSCTSTTGREAPDADSSRCARCHMPDYTRADDHVDVKPTTCGSCHGEDHWSPHEWHHSWELTGAHTDTSCTDCHGGTPPRYEGTPTACVGCHLDTLESKTFPDHLTYSRQCENCHSTTAWMPATWNGAPISAAEHAARLRGERWGAAPAPVPPAAPEAAPPEAPRRARHRHHSHRRHHRVAPLQTSAPQRFPRPDETGRSQATDTRQPSVMTPTPPSRRRHQRRRPDVVTSASHRR